MLQFQKLRQRDKEVFSPKHDTVVGKRTDSPLRADLLYISLLHKQADTFNWGVNTESEIWSTFKL